MAMLLGLLKSKKLSQWESEGLLPPQNNVILHREFRRDKRDNWTSRPAKKKSLHGRIFFYDQEQDIQVLKLTASKSFPKTLGQRIFVISFYG